MENVNLLAGFEALKTRIVELYKEHNTIIMQAAKSAANEFAPHQRAVASLLPRLQQLQKGEAIKFSDTEKRQLQAAAATSEKLLTLSKIFPAAIADQLKTMTGLARIILNYKAKKDPQNSPPNIIGEAFLRFDTKTNVASYIFVSIGDEPYIELNAAEQTIKANARIYILEDKGESLYICLATDTLERCTIPSLNIWKTPKSSKELAALNLEKDIQILRDTRSELIEGKALPIADIRKIAIIEFGNTEPAIIPDIERYIEKIWANLQTDSNANVSMTCLLTLPTDAISALTPEQKIKYAKPVGFSFTRIKLGKTENQILLVEELGEAKEDNYTVTEVDKKAALRVQDTYKIVLNDKMSEDEQLQVLEALSMLPDKILSQVPNLTVQKLSKDEMKAIDHESTGAFYNGGTHQITVSETSFNKTLGLGSNMPYETADKKDAIDDYNTHLQYVVLHETGHALDLYQYTQGYVNFANIMKKHLDKYRTEYIKNQKSMLPEAFNTWKNAEIQKLLLLQSEPKIFKSKYSGLKIIFDLENHLKNNKKYDTEHTSTSKFLEAVKADGKTPTDYASTNSKEAFAECFALYFAFPSKLKDLSPNVFKWFENEF